MVKYILSVCVCWFVTKYNKFGTFHSESCRIISIDKFKIRIYNIYFDTRYLLFAMLRYTKFVLILMLFKEMKTTEHGKVATVGKIFAKYNQQDATFHNFFTSVRRTTCYIPAKLAAGSSIGLTNTWPCMCSFELLMRDGKPSETCSASYRIKEIVKRCILLVILCECISDARTYEC